MIELLSTYLISLGVREGVKAVVNAVGNSADLPGIVDKIIGGIVGNNVNDGLRYTIAHVRQRMQQEGEADNHDLQKAVRKASLLASLGLCEAFWQESGVASNFWRRHFTSLRRKDVKWVDKLRDLLRKELKQIDKAKYVPPSTEASRQVELLLAEPKNPKIAQQFPHQLQTDLGQEWRDLLGEPPKLFLRLLRDGWNSQEKDESKHLQWFDLLCAYFAHELKTNDKVQAIFQEQLLADLKVNGVKVDVAEVETALANLSREMSDRLSEISEKVGEGSQQIETLLLALAANSETRQMAIQEGIKVIQRQLNRRTLAEKYAGVAVAQRVEQIAAGYTQLFVGRDEEFEAIELGLRQHPSQTVLVTAEAGYGKSALLANWRERQHGNGCFVAYHCFNYRGDETRSLVKGYRNILRQLYLYYQYQLEDEPLPTDAQRLQDILRGLLKKRGSKADEPLIIIFDGLDEADRPVKGVFLDDLPENVFILASVRAAADELPDYLPQWAKQGHRLHLKSLPVGAIADWVKQAGKGELVGYATDDKFIQELHRTTEGFPLYLRFLLDELIHSLGQGQDITSIVQLSPRGFEEYVRQQFRLLAHEDCIKQQAELQKLFALLCVALGGLFRNEIQDLTGLTEWDFPTLPWQVTRWFSIQNDTYSFTHPRLAQEFQKCLDTQAKKALKKLLDYCANWQQNRSAYALRYYAQHLYVGAKSESPVANGGSPLQWQELYSLARDKEFMLAQSQVIPEAVNLPLETLQWALQGAAVTDDAGAMAEFLLLHSTRQEELLQESPLEALRNGSLTRGLILADLHEIERCILWYLLLAWELKDKGRQKEAEETLKKLQQKLFSNLHMGQRRNWQEDYATYLVGCVFEVSPDICTELCGRIFEDDYCRHVLSNYLIQSDDFSKAIEVVKQMNSPFEQIFKLEKIANAQAAINAFKGARATLETAEQIADQIFPHSLWLTLIGIIAKAQIEIADRPAGQATLTQAVERSETIENPKNRVHALVWFANNLADIGEKKIALEIIDKIQSEEHQDDFLISIAEVQVKCRENEKSKMIYLRVKELAFNSQDVRKKYETLRDIARSQAGMKEWDAALETVEAIENQWSCSEALSEIVREQVRAKNFHGALATTIHIKETTSLAHALLMVAQEQASSGQFDEALQTTQSIPRSLEKSQALTAIAIQQAKAGKFEEALKTLQKIEEQRSQQDARRGIAQAYAQAKNFSAALNTAKNLDNPLRQAETLGAIAKIQAQEKPGEARDSLGIGLKIANKFDTSYLKAFAVMQLAEEQIKVGQKQEGFATAQSAYEVAQKIDDIIEQVDVESAIAEVYGKADKCKEAQEILAKTIFSAEQISYEQQNLRCKSFAAIAKAQARVGEFQQSLTTINRIEIPYFQADALKAIAKLQRSVEEKQILKAKLDAVTENIEILGFWDPVQVWTTIAVASMTLGKTQEGLNIFAQLCEQAKDDKNCSKILSQVAVAQAEAGEINLALETVEKIEDEFERVKALKTIAWFQWERQDNDAVATTLANAFQSHEKIKNQRKQLEYIREIAQIQVLAGKSQEAIKTVEKIASDRAGILITIAHLMAKLQEREHFKKLLIPCAYYSDAAYLMCGYLARLYPEQAVAIAAKVQASD